jgi:hypothetical protein
MEYATLFVVEAGVWIGYATLFVVETGVGMEYATLFVVEAGVWIGYATLFVVELEFSYKGGEHSSTLYPLFRVVAPATN